MNAKKLRTTKKTIKRVAIKNGSEIKDIGKKIEEIDINQICCISQDFDKYISNINAFDKADDFSKVLKLLSNPIRLKIILILLSKDWACNCEFETIFDEHQTLISHHLRALRNGGLITYIKKGQWKFYFICDEVRSFLEKTFNLIHQLP